MERCWTLLLNTVLLAGATCAISVPLGVVLAFLLTRTDLPGRKIGLALFGLLLFVPLYLQAAAWQAGFGVQGWHRLIWDGPVLLTGWAGAIWVQAMAALPWVVCIVGSGFWFVEPELEEQALLDASPPVVFWRVTVRSAAGAIAVATLWTIIVTAGEMTVTDLYSIRTYAEEIYTSFAGGANLENAALEVLPGMLLVVGTFFAGLMLAARLAPRDRSIPKRTSWQFRLGRWRMAAAIAVGAVLLVVIGVPLGNLCYKAGMKVVLSGDERVRTWSLWKFFTTVINSPRNHPKEFGWSLLVGSLAATGAVVGGAAIAWFARVGRARRMLLLTIVAVCLALPGPVIGLGLIRLLNHGFPPLNYLYGNTIFAPWLALVIRGLGPATLVLWHAFRSIPQDLLDAAAVDGAGPWRRFWSIGLRSRLPAVALAWLVVLAISMGDLATTILVVPPGMMTLPVRIFDLLHSGVQDRVAGICLALVFGFAAIAAFCGLLARKWGPLADFRHGRYDSLGYNGTVAADETSSRDFGAET